MRVDFDRVGQLAREAVGFVRTHSKSALNQLAKTATELFKHFLGSAGGNKQAVTGALEFSGKARQQTRAFSDEELHTFSARLDEQKASLLGDLGLLIDEDKMQQLEGSVVQHPDGLHLNNGMIVHGLGSEGGVNGGSRRFMSMSMPHAKEPLMVRVPVTVLKRSSSQEELTGDVFSHLERTSSVGWGEHGPAMFCGEKNQSQLKQLESGVKTLQRTQSLPNVKPAPISEGAGRANSLPDLMSFEPDSPRAQPDSAPVGAARTLAEHFVAPKASPSTTSQVDTGSSRASTSAEPVALPELTLAGKSPKAVGWNQAYLPSAKTEISLHTTEQLPWRGANNLGLADVKKITYNSNLCAVNTINGFFQADVVTPAQVAAKDVETLLSSYQENSLGMFGHPANPEQLLGIYHPKVLSAIQKGQSVSITKDEFFGKSKSVDAQKYTKACAQIGGLALDSNNPVQDLWRRFFNTVAPACGLAPKSPNVETAIENATEITITPETWMALQGGATQPTVLNVINQLLKTKGEKGTWSKFPKEVDLIEFNKLTPEQLKQAKSMVCYAPGHFFTMVRNDDGKWFRLDGNGAQDSEVRVVDDEKVTCDKGLVEFLKKAEVQRVIVG